MSFLIHTFGIALFVFSVAKWWGHGFNKKYQTGVTIRWEGAPWGIDKRWSGK